MDTTRKPQSVDEIPGSARAVWGGWLWIAPGEREQPWTKRATRDECEAVTLEACQRLGIAGALELDEDEGR